MTKAALTNGQTQSRRRYIATIGGVKVKLAPPAANPKKNSAAAIRNAVKLYRAKAAKK
jgi:hypothetical protein